VSYCISDIIGDRGSCVDEEVVWASLLVFRSEGHANHKTSNTIGANVLYPIFILTENSYCFQHLQNLFSHRKVHTLAMSKYVLPKLPYAYNVRMLYVFLPLTELIK